MTASGSSASGATISETGTESIAAIDNPFGNAVATHVLGTFRYPCLRAVHSERW